jgi:hypothetical protein
MTMPNFRKLDPSEVQTIQNKGKGERTLIAEQYDAILADYEVGDYGEAVLDEGENRLTIRNRMKAAASRRGIGIDFRRSNGEFVRFKITEHRNEHGTAAASEPPTVVSSEAPAKRKAGRPKAADKGAIERLGEIAGKVQDAAKGALENIGLREPAKRKGGRPKKTA